jgi:N-acetyl-anhydromuramyl-L-alanine amidase AmpD
MLIERCLLDAASQWSAGASTVGQRLSHSGQDHLWNERPSTAAIDTVVIHYISAVNVAAERAFALEPILGIFCDYGVSSHYLIDRCGRIYNLVAEEHRAWHCGGSLMPEPDNRRGVNDFSIGIELVATADSGFSAAQYRALARLCRRIESRHGTMRYVGHEDIAGTRAVGLGLRAEAKVDPGDRFSWELFHRLRAETP